MLTSQDLRLMCDTVKNGKLALMVAITQTAFIKVFHLSIKRRRPMAASLDPFKVFNSPVS